MEIGARLDCMQMYSNFHGVTLYCIMVPAAIVALFIRGRWYAYHLTLSVRNAFV